MDGLALQALHPPACISSPSYFFPIETSGSCSHPPQSSHFFYLASAMPRFWLWVHIGSRQHLPWHGSVAIRFAALGWKLSSGLAWDYVNCGLPQLPLCADFRSWETLHPRLIWSLGFSELLRAPLTPCLCFSPLLSASSVPALLFLMHVAGMDRQGVGRGDVWTWLFF